MHAEHIKQKSRTITMNLLTGNPLGVKFISFSHRLILGISFSRKDFDVAREREELFRAWVYFLIGENENNESVAYIGQATKLTQRLTSHYNDTEKDFWNQVVVFTTTDDSLKETDINFLERELIAIAKEADRCIVYNKTLWNNCLADEFKIDDLRDFIEDLKVLLSSLGFQILQKKNTWQDNEKKYFCKRKSGTMWIWYYIEEGFLVLKWSQWILANNQKYPNVYALQHKLFHEQVLDIQNQKILFLRDYVFSSPSSAASVLNGMNSNGWWAWQDIWWNTLNDNERVV